jgi:hypothetical protein
MPDQGFVRSSSCGCTTIYQHRCIVPGHRRPSGWARWSQMFGREDGSTFSPSTPPQGSLTTAIEPDPRQTRGHPCPATAAAISAVVRSTPSANVFSAVKPGGSTGRGSRPKPRWSPSRLDGVAMQVHARSSTPAGDRASARCARSRDPSWSWREHEQGHLAVQPARACTVHGPLDRAPIPDRRTRRCSDELRQR